MNYNLSEWALKIRLGPLFDVVAGHRGCGVLFQTDKAKTHLLPLK